MSSQNLLQQIKNSHSLLQASLDRGWQEFQQTETFAIANQLSEQINWWYSSQYFGVIPNPTHWYASQLTIFELQAIDEINTRFSLSSNLLS